MKIRNWIDWPGCTTTIKDTWTEIWWDRRDADAENIDAKDFWVLKTIF